MFNRNIKWTDKARQSSYKKQKLGFSYRRSFTHGNLTADVNKLFFQDGKLLVEGKPNANLFAIRDWNRYDFRMYWKRESGNDSNTTAVHADMKECIFDIGTMLNPK